MVLRGEMQHPPGFEQISHEVSNLLTAYGTDDIYRISYCLVVEKMYCDNVRSDVLYARLNRRPHGISQT